MTKKEWLFIGIFSLIIYQIQKPFTIERNRIDTRNQAQKWIEENVSPGSHILMENKHTNPQLLMCYEQLEGLVEKAKLQGLQERQTQFELMLKAHPGKGNGYWIHRIYKNNRARASLKYQSEESDQWQDLVCVNGNIQTIHDAGIQWVVVNAMTAKWDIEFAKGLHHENLGMARIEDYGDLHDFYQMLLYYWEPVKCFYKPSGFGTSDHGEELCLYLI